MAVETLDSRSFSKLQRDREANEAVSAGLENMQRLIKLLSQQLQKEQTRRGQGSLQQPKQREDCSHMADATISEFKKVVSLLSRCGHARFRRAPGGSPPASLARVVDALLEAPANCSSSSGVNPDGHGELYDKGMSSTSPDNQSPGAPAPPQVTHITMAKAHVSHINSASSTCKIEHESAPRDTTVCGGSANAHTMPQLDNIYSPSIPHVYVHLYAPDSTVLAFPTQQCFHQTPTILNPPPPQVQQCISQKQPQPQPQASEVFARSYSQLHNSISLTPPPSTANNSFASSVRMDGSSVTNDKQSIFRRTFGGSGSDGVGGSGLPPLSATKRECSGKPEEHGVGGSGLPPLSATKRKCSGKPEEHDAKCNSSGRCHCAKRRKVKDKRTVRVPAISMADTPVDLFSWRKYGQKPVKGSPYPRGYFKCSTVRACPARKHVEQALDDPNILVVTYKGEHNHS